MTSRRIDCYLKDLLDEDRYDFYSAVRDFSDDAIGPKVLEWERKGCHIPDSAIAQMAELGLFGIPVPESVTNPSMVPVAGGASVKRNKQPSKSPASTVCRAPGS